MRKRSLAVIALGLGAAVLVSAAPAAIWLDVPFIRQEKDACGSASVAMIMKYWRQQPGHEALSDADPVSIQHALYAPQAHGIYASAIENYFRQNGFQTFAVAGTWDDLRHHLEKGRPLLVALQPGDRAPLHYVVVAGLDDDQNLVLENDPAQRKLLKQNRLDFERDWKRAHNWLLLALPESTAH